MEEWGRRTPQRYSLPLSYSQSNVSEPKDSQTSRFLRTSQKIPSQLSLDDVESYRELFQKMENSRLDICFIGTVGRWESFVASIKYLTSMYWEDDNNTMENLMSSTPKDEDLETMVSQIQLKRRLVVFQRETELIFFLHLPENQQYYHLVELPSHEFRPAISLYNPPHIVLPLNQPLVLPHKHNFTKSRVGFIGPAEAGKSSLINTTLKLQILPESFPNCCTLAPIILKSSERSDFIVTVKRVHPKQILSHRTTSDRLSSSGSQSQMLTSMGQLGSLKSDSYKLRDEIELHNKLRELTERDTEHVEWETVGEIEVEGPFNIPVGLELVELPDDTNVSTVSLFCSCTHFVIVTDNCCLATQLQNSVADALAVAKDPRRVVVCPSKIDSLLCSRDNKPNRDLTSTYQFLRIIQSYRCILSNIGKNTSEILIVPTSSRLLQSPFRIQTYLLSHLFGSLVPIVLEEVPKNECNEDKEYKDSDTPLTQQQLDKLLGEQDVFVANFNGSIVGEIVSMVGNGSVWAKINEKPEKVVDRRGSLWFLYDTKNKIVLKQRVGILASVALANSGKGQETLISITIG